MLYHAILQLNQKAKQTAKQSQNITGQKRHVRTKLSNKKTKKAKAQIISQTAFNKQNTVDRRTDFKKLTTSK